MNRFENKGLFARELKNFRVAGGHVVKAVPAFTASRTFNCWLKGYYSSNSNKPRF